MGLREGDCGHPSREPRAAAELSLGDPLTPSKQGLTPPTGVSGRTQFPLCWHLPVKGGDNPGGQQEEVPSTSAKMVSRLPACPQQTPDLAGGVRYRVSWPVGPWGLAWAKPAACPLQGGWRGGGRLWSAPRTGQQLPFPEGRGLQVSAAMWEGDSCSDLSPCPSLPWTDSTGQQD